MSAQCPRKRRETAKALRREFGITVDGRSRQAKALRRFRAQLVAHIGGSPTPVQEALIASVCQLRLRLLALDESFARSGRMTETESRHYRGWVQSYHAALRELGLQPAPDPQPPDIFARVRAEVQARLSAAREGATVPSLPERAP